MKLMSFMLTKEQFRNRTKTVTRRYGWYNAKPGDRYEGVEKGQGLKKGEHPVRMGVIEVVTVRQERLSELLTALDERTDDSVTYTSAEAKADCRKEGFPDLSPAQFVAMFCEHNNVKPDAWITRIEFKYHDPQGS